MVMSVSVYGQYPVIRSVFCMMGDILSFVSGMAVPVFLVYGITGEEAMRETYFIRQGVMEGHG